MDRFSKTEMDLIWKLRKYTIESCEECNDGWKIQKTGTVCECGCRKIFIFLKEMIYSKIPREYWHLELDKLMISPEDVKIDFTKYFDNFEIAIDNGLSFCILGRNGIGKTSLLAEVAKKSIQSDLKTIYMTAQDYINAKMLNDYAFLSRVEVESQVVLLDELDKPYKKKGSDYVITQIENFLRTTLPQNKIVHIASNWTKEMIKQNLGDSTYSIMNRKMKFITLLGEDLSEEVGEKWDEKLEGKRIDYLSDYFKGMAKGMSRFMNDTRKNSLQGYKRRDETDIISSEKGSQIVR